MDILWKISSHPLKNLLLKLILLLQKKALINNLSLVFTMQDLQDCLNFLFCFILFLF